MSERPLGAIDVPPYRCPGCSHLNTWISSPLTDDDNEFDCIHCQVPLLAVADGIVIDADKLAIFGKRRA